MRKIIVFVFCITFFSPPLFAQFTKYIVKFKDKTGVPFSINNPSKFLSQRAIQRREKQNIPIDETDLPVVPSYIDSIRLSGNVLVLNQSKWLNQICVETADSAALQKINRFSFVSKTQPVKRLQLNPENRFAEKTIDKFKGEIENFTSIPSLSNDHYAYGFSSDQIRIHHGEFLHNMGFHGEGMIIAIIDAGFYHYKTLPVFDSVNIKNLVIETHDFVDNEESVNEDDSHGMKCFSIIAGNLPNKLVGSSPEAKFLLYRSEDVFSESPVEEQYWIAAAERADSAGADVITTSLGYNLFDNPDFDYSYQDMNGHTSMIAKASTIAAGKGMIILAAAGNEGNDSWHFIITPADAENILAVGAVDGSGMVAPFSSFGPSSDGRVKPDVASVGWGTAISSIDGKIVSGNGTSFATPNLAGLVTCLWQAFPEFTNLEIIKTIQKSCTIYDHPDNRIGYGIPDFQKAFDDLNQQRILKRALIILGNQTLKIYPNPFKNHFSVLIKPERTSNSVFSLFDATGRLYFSKQISLQQGVIRLIDFDMMPSIQKGIYILKYYDGKYTTGLKVVVD
ncbi:MAG: S8 family serine peptidase [Ginsengibacter sp.]